MQTTRFRRESGREIRVFPPNWKRSRRSTCRNRTNRPGPRAPARSRQQRAALGQQDQRLRAALGFSSHPSPGSRSYFPALPLQVRGAASPALCVIGFLTPAHTLVNAPLTTQFGGALCLSLGHQPIHGSARKRRVINTDPTTHVSNTGPRIYISCQSRGSGSDFRP